MIVLIKDVKRCQDVWKSVEYESRICHHHALVIIRFKTHQCRYLEVFKVIRKAMITSTLCIISAFHISRYSELWTHDIMLATSRCKKNIVSHSVVQCDNVEYAKKSLA